MANDSTLSLVVLVIDVNRCKFGHVNDFLMSEPGRDIAQMKEDRLQFVIVSDGDYSEFVYEDNVLGV